VRETSRRKSPSMGKKSSYPVLKGGPIIEKIRSGDSCGSQAHKKTARVIYVLRDVAFD